MARSILHSEAVVYMNIVLFMLLSCQRQGGEVLFKFFFNFWMKNERCGDILHNAWNQPTEVSPMLRLCLKLKRLKPLMKALNADCYINISVHTVRVNEARDE